MKKSEQKSAPVDPVAVLGPVLEDRVLMALIKSRYVPMSYIFKRVSSRPTIKGSLQVARAFVALRRKEDGHAKPLGIYELESHFAIVSDELHISGSKTSRKGEQVLEDVGIDEVRQALAMRSKGRKFAVDHYSRLRKRYKLYEKVLRECERSTKLEEALSRLGLDDADWQNLKSWMNRFGLSRDIVYGRPIQLEGALAIVHAQPILLEGTLAREIEQRFLGQRFEDVVPRLLRRAVAREIEQLFQGKRFEDVVPEMLRTELATPGIHSMA